MGLFPIALRSIDIELAKKAGAKSLLMVDDNVTLNVKRFEELCKAIVEYGHDVDYFVQASVAAIASRGEVARKMAKAGVKAVFLGIESVREEDSQLLNIRGKQSGLESVKRAVRFLEENDVMVFGGFILGNPDDDEEAFWKTLKIAKELRLDIPVFYLVTPYPKTRIRHELLNRKLITNRDKWSSYECFTPTANTESLTSEEVSFLHWRIYEKWFDNLRWLANNRIRKHYPLYFLKMVAKTWGPHLWKRLLLKLKAKSEEELWAEDIAKRKTVYSPLKTVR